MAKKFSKSRRKFLKTASAASLAAPYFVSATALGLSGAVPPSDRIVMGAIGTGGKGNHNTQAFLPQKDIQFVAVCDVDANHLAACQEIVNKHYRNEDCKAYKDFRELLARDDIDAVHVSTPDHWHALASITALKAGKDVYCEKPLANSVGEAIAIRDAVKKNKRVLQTGSHERSTDTIRFACELVRNGRIGKLQTIVIQMPCDQDHHKQVIDFKEMPAPAEIPADLDWDFWLGHTPLAPYHSRRCHFWWRFILAYGGGEMTDRGAHIIDIGQLANGTDGSGPVEFEATGTRNANGLYNAFMDYKFTNTYANGVKLIGENKGPRGLKLIGENGWIFIHIHGGKLEAHPVDLLEQKIEESETSLGRSAGGHHRNFLDCVKSRQEPMASAEVGCRTATICHLNNIAMLTGRKLKWDPETEKIIGDDEAAQWLTPVMRKPWGALFAG